MHEKPFSSEKLNKPNIKQAEYTGTTINNNTTAEQTPPFTTKNSLKDTSLNTHGVEKPFGLNSIPKSIMAGRYAYMALGLAMAVWASLIPFAKQRLAVNEAELGILLLCLGLGAVLSMAVAGSFTARYGCQNVQRIGIPFYYLSLFGLSVMPSPLTLALCLILFGIWSGILDVAMNIQVVYLEQASKKRLMSSLHAMYMIGVAFGAGFMAFLLNITDNSVLATVIACIVAMLGFLYFQHYFFPKIAKDNEEKTPLIVIPKGIIFWLGFICFFLYMIEGVLMDWSALFMHEVRHVDLSEAGLGYALFAVTMTCGRLFGDRLGACFGSRNVLLYGLIFSIFCFWGISIIYSIPLLLFTFFCLGVFASNSVPMLFSLATKNTAGSLSTCIAGVSMLGYLGLLAGPAIMGFVAHTFGLSFVFVTMGFFLAGITLLFSRLKIVE